MLVSDMSLLRCGDRGSTYSQAEVSPYSSTESSVRARVVSLSAGRWPNGLRVLSLRGAKLRQSRFIRWSVEAVR